MKKELLNYEDIKNSELVYAGYSSNINTSKSIADLIKATEKLEKQTGIKCYPVIRNLDGFGLYIYADEIYKDFCEMMRLKNYYEVIELELEKLKNLLIEKEKIQQKIDKLEVKLKNYRLTHQHEDKGE